MKQKILIVGNWKMELGVRESTVLARSMARAKPAESVRAALCPSFPALMSVAEALGRRSNILLGAQDVYSAGKGAYTGAVSVPMLKELGCHYVIVGHSDRRKYFHESDKDVREKLEAAVAGHVTPILCVGETGVERRRGKNKTVVLHQLRQALMHGKRLRGNIVVAYEPVWAISGNAGHAADPRLIKEMHIMISTELKRLLAPSLFRRTPLLYGGSVNASDVRLYVGPKKMDGALVGGASLTAKSFFSILKAVSIF